MKKTIIVLTLLLMAVAPSAFSQQDPQYTQYMYNMNVLNPAYAGSKDVLSIGLLGRTQWVNLDGAPKTLTLSLHSPVWKNLGLGVSVIHDEIGPVKEDNVYADFSYTIQTSENAHLAFGLKAGFTFLDVKLTKTNDPDPLNVPIHKAMPNIGVGLYYYTNRFYAGLSAPNFLKTRHLEKKKGIYSTASERAHFFLTAGYVFEPSETLKLKPSTMVKATGGAPLSIDLSLNALFNEFFEIGLSYRLDDSVSAMLGINISKDFRIGYAYDHTITSFGQFNSGSHEIMILYDFYKRDLKSPRFF